MNLFTKVCMLCILFLPFVSSGQYEAKIEKRLAMLDQKLNLTEVQKKEIKSIFTEFAKETHALQKSDHTDIKMQRKALNARRIEKVQSVLNSKQKIVFESMKSQKADLKDRKSVMKGSAPKFNKFSNSKN